MRKGVWLKVKGKTDFADGVLSGVRYVYSKQTGNSFVYWVATDESGKEEEGTAELANGKIN